MVHCERNVCQKFGCTVGISQRPDGLCNVQSPVPPALHALTTAGVTAMGEEAGNSDLANFALPPATSPPERLAQRGLDIAAIHRHHSRSGFMGHRQINKSLGHILGPHLALQQIAGHVVGLAEPTRRRA